MVASDHLRRPSRAGVLRPCSGSSTTTGGLRCVHPTPAAPPEPGRSWLRAAHHGPGRPPGPSPRIRASAPPIRDPGPAAPAKRAREGVCPAVGTLRRASAPTIHLTIEPPVESGTTVPRRSGPAARGRAEIGAREAPQGGRGRRERPPGRRRKYCSDLLFSCCLGLLSSRGKGRRGGNGLPHRVVLLSKRPDHSIPWRQERT